MSSDLISSVSSVVLSVNCRASFSFNERSINVSLCRMEFKIPECFAIAIPLIYTLKASRIVWKEVTEPMFFSKNMSMASANSCLNTGSKRAYGGNLQVKGGMFSSAYVFAVIMASDLIKCEGVYDTSEFAVTVWRRSASNLF